MTERENITLEELYQIKEDINETVGEKSALSRFWGFLTFVNIVWFIAIAGMSITVIPCIHSIFGEVIKRVAKIFLEFMKTAIKWFLKNVLIPLITFLHTWGFLELFGYLLCFQFVTEGARSDKEETFGFMIALTGLCFIIPLFVYGTKLHLKKRRAKKNIPRFINLLVFWLCLCYIPMTIEFQSSLMGYVVFFMLFFVFSFGTNSFAIEDLFDYRSRACEKVFFSSTFWVLVYSILRLTGLRFLYLKPFANPICFVGGNIMYFSVLILSANLYWDARYDRWGFDLCHRWAVYNIVNVLLLAGGYIIGGTSSMNGLKYTAVLYTIFYILQKYAHLYASCCCQMRIDCC